MDRAALLMRADEGLPYEEIAVALSLPVATVKVKVHRARLKLAQMRTPEDICEMNVTQNVIHDLLPAYLAGEASADTVTLVEEFLRLDPDLARTVEALRSTPLPEPALALRPTQEKETLNMTKQLLTGEES